MAELHPLRSKLHSSALRKIMCLESLDDDSTRSAKVDTVVDTISSGTAWTIEP